MRTILVLVICVAVLTATVSPATSGAAEPIKIGAITSLTGRFATFGKLQQAGYKVAMNELASASVLGRPIQLLLEDDQSSENAALSAAEKLINQGVPLIVGAYSSGITKPLAGYLARQKVPLLVDTSSDDAITNPGSEWVLRMNPNATTYAKTLFDLFDSLGGIKTVAIIAGTGAFEQSVHVAARAIAAQRHYQLVGTEAYDRGLTDFRPVLNRFKGANPDILFMVSYEEDAVAIMRQAKEVNITPKIFAGAAAGFALDTFIKGAGDAAEWVVTATAWAPDVTYPGARNLYERLKEAYGGEPSYHAAEAYAGLLVAVEAIKRANSLDRDAVRRALTGLEMTTPFGPIAFKNYLGFKNQNPIAMLAQQVQGGKFITTFPSEVAAGKIKFPTPAWNQR